MILYHGSDRLDSLKNIVEKGFDLNKIGSGWGTTYGNGVYFTDNLEVANKVYSNNSGYVLKVTIEVNVLKLYNDYSVSNKKKINNIISKYITNKNYNMIITNSKEPEYILFDIDCINKIELLHVYH